ncbi:MAG: AhpC/TSA family protein [Bacteroidales bacterium]|nr:AhpC/TSA family protein [Bacteroidales bacterium]
MKNAFWILAIAAILAACNGSSGKYEINGKVEGASPGWVVLSKAVDNALVAIDSLETSDGTVYFTGTIELPEVYFLEFKSDQMFHRLFVEPGQIVISGNVKSPVFAGSESQKQYDSFNEAIKKLDDQRNLLYEDFRQAMETGDTVRVEEIKNEAGRIDDMQDVFTKDFVKSNSNNVVGAYVIVNNIYQFELEDLEGLRAAMNEKITASKYVSMIDEKIARLQSVSIGKQAPVFSQNDTAGQAVLLDEFKGKYLLIDFWASWCSPCRQENPNVVAAYQKYHDKGFDILGVSLDKDRDRWLDAIAVDGLTWTHVSDLKGWQNEASNKYGVSSIPANFLLDPDGIIIAKNLREQALHEKLNEIFN